MSASTAPRAVEQREVYKSEGAGWITFAGWMLAILGVMNVVYGVAAIADASVYVNGARYVFSDLSTWGWIMLLVGAAQFFGAFSIWNRSGWGRWVGIASAAVNAVLQLLFMPAFPLLALALFGLGILVLYALIAYGSREEVY